MNAKVEAIKEGKYKISCIFLSTKERPVNPITMANIITGKNCNLLEGIEVILSGCCIYKILIRETNL